MIYFLQRQDGAIKIGTTVRLSERRKQLESAHGTLGLLGVLGGGYLEEKELHERYAHWCVEGEWFRPCSPLTTFIETRAEPWDGADEKPMAKSLRIDADVLGECRAAAGLLNVGISEFISDVLRKVVPGIREKAHADKYGKTSPPKKKP